MTVKASYLVTGQDLQPTYDPKDGESVDYGSEKKALDAAKELLANTEGQAAEVWVWKLSHVLSKPDVEPVIERVK